MMRAAIVGAAVALGLAFASGGGASAQPNPFGNRSATQVVEDGALLVAVKAKLSADDPDSTTTLGVSVDRGMVTLRGSVHTAEQRRRAASDARGVRGVRGVVDQLQLSMNGPHPREVLADWALAARVETAIQVEAGFQPVAVHADRGTVTLSGTVGSAATRARVAGAARGTDGVRNVVDQLRVGGT